MRSARALDAGLMAGRTSSLPPEEVIEQRRGIADGAREELGGVCAMDRLIHRQRRPRKRSWEEFAEERRLEKRQGQVSRAEETGNHFPIGGLLDIHDSVAGPRGHAGSGALVSSRRSSRSVLVQAGNGKRWGSLASSVSARIVEALAKFALAYSANPWAVSMAGIGVLRYRPVSQKRVTGSPAADGGPSAPATIRGFCLTKCSNPFENQLQGQACRVGLRWWYAR